MRNVTTLRRVEDIDALVDDLLADPTRADELKAELRRRFRVVEAPRPKPQPLDELEAFWDNVPV